MLSASEEDHRLILTLASLLSGYDRDGGGGG